MGCKPFAALPPLWCNPPLGAAGAARSQGLSAERDVEDLDILRRKDQLRPELPQGCASGALDPATEFANDWILISRPHCLFVYVCVCVWGAGLTCMWFALIALIDNWNLFILASVLG